MLVLASHVLCPYVQRAAIVLAEKEVPYERRDVDLARKPAWFLAISPLGKTPVLLVNQAPIFESAVICEYLEETLPRPLHPQDPLHRAQHRSWMEFGSAILNAIGAFYAAPDADALERKQHELRVKFTQLDDALGDGPYFAGSHFCMVDAVFGPVFRYFDVFDTIADFGIFAQRPKIQAWRHALANRPSVIAAVSTDYPAALEKFLVARGSELSRLILARRSARPTASHP
ncbi:glutathione S-transferase family protein [Burkholderia sp. Bp9012]|uniref:glutathione S-transferase family protein n=1 Tax=Burkholderia sp. Bp9012 TaxID=2184562 RepID=UPI000F5A3A33|nr:glutathione S-transferase family protein [Burkholderia sp. Bp9012]RQR79136.1 glutathione S-transferase family protein [Burkholderia sp. Bp9012]